MDDFEVIRLLQDLFNAIPRTFVRHLLRFYVTRRDLSVI